MSPEYTTITRPGFAPFGLRTFLIGTTWTSARVAFSVGTAGPVRLTVHDALGREVARALDRSLPSGEHAARLDLRDLAPGVYLVRLLAADGVEAVPLTVVR